jgi:hypothetical protein
MTIFDINTHEHVDRFYVWTALTRSTDLSQVAIFQHSKRDDKSADLQMKEQYFLKKVEGYKQQDRNAGRQWESKDYITANWIKEVYGTLEIDWCELCHTRYDIVVENGKVHSNLTVDRLDNSKPHVKDNCRLLCDVCNKTRGNRY